MKENTLTNTSTYPQSAYIFIAISITQFLLGSWGVYLEYQGTHQAESFASLGAIIPYGTAGLLFPISLVCLIIFLLRHRKNKKAWILFGVGILFLFAIVVLRSILIP